MSGKNEKIVYTGHFVTNQDELLWQLPPAITGEGSTVHAHHVTKEFMPADGKEGIEPGRGRVLRITGQVIGEGVHAAVVESADGSPLSRNEYPHITIATAEGVSPVKSNEVVAKAHREGTVKPVEPPIALRTVEGYFDGEQVHTQ